MGRAALELTISQLAELAGVSVNTVQRFEQGGDARLSSVEKMRVPMEQKGVQFFTESDGTQTVRISGSAQTSSERAK